MPSQSEPVDNQSGGPRILVVDDEPDVADILSEGLEHFGFCVDVAYSGAEALEALKAARYDSLLSDVQMPRMRGDELQRLARSIQPELAVILVTAATDLSIAVKCFHEGICDYITKPFDLGDVAARVNRALERERLIRENHSYQENLELRVAEQAAQIRRMFAESLQALNRALEAKDEYTRDHSCRVAATSVAIARELRPGDEEIIDRLGTAALFHDIGKIGVPEAILTKPGKLTCSEWDSIKRHPEIGETILRPIFRDPVMLSVVRSHHERCDGAGYPDGLCGDETALEARIVAVADAFDAMTSARSYRQAMPRQVALQTLRDGRGTQWDPAVVDAFVSIADTVAVNAPAMRLLKAAEIPFDLAA